MTTATELTPLLKRLKLGAMLNKLPERIALARREELDYASFLQVILTDEVNRRDHRRLELRLQQAGFDPVGVGKSFIAQALGYAAVRAGHSVRFIRADDFFRAMAQARVDHSTDKTFRSFLSPDLLILDDLGLHRLTHQASHFQLRQ